MQPIQLPSGRPLARFDETYVDAELLRKSLILAREARNSPIVCQMVLLHYVGEAQEYRVSARRHRKDGWDELADGSVRWADTARDAVDACRQLSRGVCLLEGERKLASAMAHAWCGDQLWSDVYPES